MPYVPELDDMARQQVRFGAAGNQIVLWPKENGVGNITVDASPAPTFEAHRPGDGATTTAQASGTCTVDNSQGVTRLVATIDCTQTQLWQLNIYYYWILFTWYSSGAIRTYELPFDVVRDPWIPNISLNNLIEEVSDMQRRLTAQAARLLSSRTPEAHASVMAMKAWLDVWEFLRQKTEEAGNFLPSLIVDKVSLRRVTIAQTIFRIYEAEGAPEGSDEAKLAAKWKNEAQHRLTTMPPLRYMIADARAPIQTVQAWRTMKTSRGVW